MDTRATTTLKEKIHRAVDQTDDGHLLELVYSLVNQNDRFNAFNLSERHVAGEGEKGGMHCPNRSFAFSEVKKKILENLGK